MAPALTTSLGDGLPCCMRKTTVWEPGTGRWPGCKRGGSGTKAFVCVVALALCKAQGLPINLFETSYFLSCAIVVPNQGSGLANGPETLFARMPRNAGRVAGRIKPPNNCVIGLGTWEQI